MRKLKGIPRKKRRKMVKMNVFRAKDHHHRMWFTTPPLVLFSKLFVMISLRSRAIRESEGSRCRIARCTPPMLGVNARELVL